MGATLWFLLAPGLAGALAATMRDSMPRQGR